MSKKSFIIILVLSVVVTYGAAIADFALNISKGATGLPFGFSQFNFLGGETNSMLFIVDVIFWFVILFGIWKLILKTVKK